MLLAGIIIGLSCIVYLHTYQLNPIIAAILFSIGLLYIRISKSILFTGYTQKWCNKQINTYTYLKILITNLLGVFLIYLLFIEDKDIGESIYTISINKFEQHWFQLYLNSIVCGSLMTIATYSKTPLILSSLCVVGFILGGFNHCIADFFYLLKIFNYENFIKYLIIIIGNIVGGCIVTKFEKI